MSLSKEDISKLFATADTLEVDIERAQRVLDAHDITTPEQFLALSGQTQCILREMYTTLVESQPIEEKTRQEFSGD